MPLCEACHTYFAIKPCPNCIKPTSRRINATEKLNLIEKKGIWITSTVDELEFIWAQICQKTVQRVRTNNVMLRQGYFIIKELDNMREYKFEFIGSTFNQSFQSRIERLYPGIENIFIVSDIVGQNFSFPNLKEILDDIFLVNRSRIKEIHLIWLEPYINVQSQYDDYKDDVKEILASYFNSKNYQMQIIEISFPMYSSDRFSDKLKDIFVSLSSSEEIKDLLRLPLRPLFRNSLPLLDPNSSNRVIILDIEPSPIDNIQVISNTATIDLIESEKCIACSIIIESIKVKCLTCNGHFCNNCTNFITSDESFCLGSIYHGLHRFTKLK